MLEIEGIFNFILLFSSSCTLANELRPTDFISYLNKFYCLNAVVFPTDGKIPIRKVIPTDSRIFLIFVREKVPRGRFSIRIPSLDLATLKSGPNGSFLLETQ